MPVSSGAIFQGPAMDGVYDSNLDPITPVGFDQWSGKLAIDGHHAFLVNTYVGRQCISTTGGRLRKR